MFIEQIEIFDIDVNFLIMMVKTINIHGNQHWLKALIINLHIDFLFIFGVIHIGSMIKWPNAKRILAAAR